MADLTKQMMEDKEVNDLLLSYAKEVFGELHLDENPPLPSPFYLPPSWGSSTSTVDVKPNPQICRFKDAETAKWSLRQPLVTTLDAPQVISCVRDGRRYYFLKTVGEDGKYILKMLQNPPPGYLHACRERGESSKTPQQK